MNNIKKLLSDTIVKSLETANDEEIAQAYNHIVSCGDYPYWHKCQNLHCCYSYILDKLEKEK